MPLYLTPASGSECLLATRDEGLRRLLAERFPGCGLADRVEAVTTSLGESSTFKHVLLLDGPGEATAFLETPEARAFAGRGGNLVVAEAAGPASTSWDLLADATAAGFASSGVLSFWSDHYGYLGRDHQVMVMAGCQTVNR